MVNGLLGLTDFPSASPWSPRTRDTWHVAMSSDNCHALILQITNYKNNTTAINLFNYPWKVTVGGERRQRRAGDHDWHQHLAAVHVQVRGVRVQDGDGDTLLLLRIPGRRWAVSGVEVTMAGGCPVSCVPTWSIAARGMSRYLRCGTSHLVTRRYTSGAEIWEVYQE